MSSRAASTALCSVALASTRVAPLPFSASARASVPPLVKIRLSGSAPAQRASVSRAPSRTAFAARPPLCTDDGLPVSVSTSAMAARAATQTGVVAAWSR